MARGRRGRPAGRGIWTLPEERLAELRRQSGRTLRNRWQRATATLLLALQAGVSGGLAWFVANNLLHHPQPVFAPLAAVITLDISIAQRLRRAAELVLGVALGIGVGDALIKVIGTGAWQLGVAVVLATVFSVLVGGGPAVVGQAASAAVLIATLAPPTHGIYYGRFVDALIGGGAALVVMALLLPANPLRVVARKAGPACGLLADCLAETAGALADRDVGRANTALTRLDQGEALLRQFREIIPEGRETARVAPLRWRARSGVAQYVESVDYLDRCMTNARVLVRRSVTLLDDREPVPDQLPRSVALLAEATRELRQALERGRPPQQTSELALRAVREAAGAYTAGPGFSGDVVVAQIRAVATDLLGTAGMHHREANELIRKATGTLSRR
jgi:uncharacterized membrane protein YgaE (UPF0421/DUF939 family)